MLAPIRRSLSTLGATTALALSILPATSAAADPAPFQGNLVSEGIGLACVADAGNHVRKCDGGPPSKTNESDRRVKSWDGQPIDADVTLPESGDGPWPLVIMVHGYAGTKKDTEGGSADSGHGLNNIRFAQNGYAVINYSTRGFGASCGSVIGYIESGYTSDEHKLGLAACDDNRYVHLADARFEVHDAQHMAGLLVGGGIVDPQRIGITGESYGGGHSLILAQLKDRVMRTDGTTEPWTSPDGTPMSLAGAFAIAPWSDLANSLLPNGRSLDSAPDAPDTTTSPIGVMKQSWVDALYTGGLFAGNYPPKGCKDIEGPCADLRSWYGKINQGEPYDQSEMGPIATEVRTYHSAIGVSPPEDGPAPTAIASGWTDDLFPAVEGIRIYNRTRTDYPDVPMELMLADIGHARAQNKGADREATIREGIDWLDRYVKDDGDAPANTGVRAWTQTCPEDEPSAGPYDADSWQGLHPGQVTFSSSTPQDVDAHGGDPWVSYLVATHPIDDQLGYEDVGAFPAGADPCRDAPTGQDAGVAIYTLPASDGYTLMGFPTVEANIATAGGGTTYGELVARLWDVDPTFARQTLVARGAYRLAGNEKGTVTMQLNANGWRFEKGHVPKVELLGREAGNDAGIGLDIFRDANPYRPSNNLDFEVAIDSVKVTLPTLEPSAEVPQAGAEQLATEQAASEQANTEQTQSGGGESAKPIELALKTTSLSLAEGKTKKLHRKTLAKLVATGFKGYAEQTGGISKIKALLVRKSGKHCYRIDQPSERTSCTRTSSQGIKASADETSQHFTYRPLATLSGARHTVSAKRTLERMSRGEILRKGSYELRLKVYPKQGEARTFAFLLEVS